MTRARDLADSADKDIAGTLTVDDLTASGDVTIAGDLTVSGTTSGGGSSGTHTGDVVGNVTGNLTGNVTGDLTGNVTGDLTGNVNFTGDVDFGANKITYANVYANLSDLPSASTYHGMFAHVHATGKAYYSHGGNWIELNSGLGIDDNATSTAMTLDSSGNLLVGHTGSVYNNVNATSTEGISLTENGEIFACSSQSSGVMILNRKTTDGNILTFDKDGTTVGSIASKDGDTAIGTSGVGIRFGQNNSDQITPHSMSTNGGKDNSISLGSSGARFKDLYLSGGVYLGGTGSANKLTDYETGSWTCTLNTAPTGLSNLASSSNLNKYTKIGNVVILQGVLSFNTSSSSANTVDVAGLPFTSSSDTGTVGSQINRYGSSLVPMPYIGANSNSIQFYAVANTGNWDSIQYSEVGVWYVHFQITYFTA